MAYYDGNKVGSIIRPARRLTRKTLSLNQIGYNLAYLDGVDGYSAVYCTPPALPSGTRDYIEGNNEITSLYIPEDVFIVTGNFQCFPNLKYFIIGNHSAIVSIASNAFDGTKVLTEGEIIVPNNLVDNYKIAYSSWASKFTSWIYNVNFVIPFVGDAILTQEYVQHVISLTSGDISNVTKVVVPVGFTSFGAGALDEIFASFENLVTFEWQTTQTFSGQDLNGIFETSENWPAEVILPGMIWDTKYNPSLGRITLPTSITSFQVKRLVGGFNQGSGLIYSPTLRIFKILESVGYGYWNGSIIVNTDRSDITQCTANNIREIDFGDISEVTNPSIPWAPFSEVWPGVSTSVDWEFDLRMRNIKRNLIIGNGNPQPISVNYASLLYIISQLVDMGETRTIQFGNVNMAKLYPQDIQAVYDKGWSIINPAPSAFTFALDGVDYNADFGMTWEQWIASNYNTGGYYLDNGIVYESTGTKVVIEANGSIAMANKMVRAGTTYSVTTMPVLSTVTIPFSSDTELTASAVEAYAETLADTMVVGKVIVPSDFTSYESGAFASAKNVFANLVEVEWQATMQYARADLGTLLAEMPDKVSLPNTELTGYGVQIDFKNVVEFTAGSINGFGSAGSSHNKGANLERFVLTKGIAGYCNNFFISFATSTPKLTYIDFGEDIGLTNLLSGSVYGFSNIELKITNLKVNSDIHLSTYTHDSLVYIINNLYDYTGDTQHTLTIGATNLAKLSAAEIAIATAKNWILQ